MYKVHLMYLKITEAYSSVQVATHAYAASTLIVQRSEPCLDHRSCVYTMESQTPEIQITCTRSYTSIMLDDVHTHSHSHLPSWVKNSQHLHQNVQEYLWVNHRPGYAGMLLSRKRMVEWI